MSALLSIVMMIAAAAAYIFASRKFRSRETGLALFPTLALGRQNWSFSLGLIAMFVGLVATVLMFLLGPSTHFAFALIMAAASGLLGGFGLLLANLVITTLSRSGGSRPDN